MIIIIIIIIIIVIVFIGNFKNYIEQQTCSIYTITGLYNNNNNNYYYYYYYINNDNKLTNKLKNQ